MLTPRLDQVTTRKALESHSRGPFRDVLARLLGCAPSDEAITRQAEAHPDRWAQTLAITARLAGYNEKLEIEGSFDMRVSDLSDAELLAAIVAMDGWVDTQSTELDPLKPVNPSLPAVD